MGTSYIVASADKFVSKLETIQTNLGKVSNEINEQKEKVMGKNGVLAKFENKANVLKIKYSPKTKKLNDVEEQLHNVLNTVGNNIKNWNCEIEKYAKGMSFIKKHENYFVVMVFGAVKTGKSSLGNFLAGKNFRNAVFENKYKHLSEAELAIEQEGRETGGIVTSEGKNYFAEGVIDTTGNIQYFSLAGMRWMDTPGLGAVAKAEDKVRMDEMVNEYIPYADMCIFLVNSSEPGVLDEFDYMNKMINKDQAAIIVITKSDKPEFCIKNGKIIQHTVAKPEDNRKLQQEDIVQRLKKKYPYCDDKKYKIISISTEVAKNAIDNCDDELYKSSNLDKFMEELGAACDNAGELKVKHPRQAFNNFISTIIEGDNSTYDDENKITFKSIADLKCEVNKIRVSAQKYKNEINERENNLYSNLRSKIKNEIYKELHQMSNNVEKTGAQIEKSVIDKTITEIVNKNVNTEINKTLKNIIDNYENRQIALQALSFASGDLKREKNSSTTKYTVVDYEVRPPEGVWENVCDFFGKKYYRRVTRNVEVAVETVVGTNVGEITENLMKVFDGQLKSIIHNELTKLQKTYFAPQEIFVEEMDKLLSELEIELTKLKFKIN